MKLKSKRLQYICDMIQKCRCMADIGTDHALVPIYTVLNSKADRAIAADIRTGPLKAAMKNICRYSLEDRIETRLSDGLCSFSSNEADVYVIAGMGGFVIRDILNAYANDPFESDTVFLIQTNTAEYELRRFLFLRGFYIEYESSVTEYGHTYLIMRCRYTGLEKTDADITYNDNIHFYTGTSMLCRDSAEAREYYTALLVKAQNISSGLKKSQNECDEIQLKLYDELIRYIKANTVLRGGVL